MQNNDQTGFCIAYSVRETLDKGLGVFAEAAIGAGAIVWRHVSGLYQVFDEHSLRSHLKDLSPTEAAYELEHIFAVAEFPGYVIRVHDDGVLVNHSDQPNLAMGANSSEFRRPTITSIEEVVNALTDRYYSLFALQDLKAGDELTLNYHSDTEDPEYYNSLCQEYGVTYDWL